MSHTVLLPVTEQQQAAYEQAARMLVTAIIAEYNPTPHAIDKGAFLLVEGAVRRAGNFDTARGFSACCDRTGAMYNFYTKGEGEATTYHMDWFQS